MLSVHYFLNLQKKSLHTNFIGTGPGFWNIAMLAQRRGIPVTKMNAEAQDGYCPTSQNLTELLGERNLDLTILYETPMANPTSTVYDPDTFRKSLETFVKLRPNGVIILDLVYIEMIPLEKTLELFNQITPEIRKRIIFSSSMSKLFGYPKIRMADLHTDNDWLFTELPGMENEIPEKENVSLFKALQEQWKAVIVTLSEPTELESIAIWKYVSREDREGLYRLFRGRQTAVLQRIMSVNDERTSRGLPPIIDISRAHRDIPLYLYAQLAKDIDFLDFFVETGILGAPGTMFEDLPVNNMIRMSMGIVSLEEEQE